MSMPSVSGVHASQTRSKFSPGYTSNFKDRLSTRTNLFAKHIVDDDRCERCTGHVEDRHHVFFDCPTSSGVWSRLHIASVTELSDVDVWNATVPANLDAKLWPFILQTILWRLWDARNGKKFRAESPTSRSIISKVCGDLVIWRHRLRNDRDVTSLNAWRCYPLSCNTAASSASAEF